MPWPTTLGTGRRVWPLSDLRSVYRGALVVCGEYTLERGNTVIQDGLSDAVAFGRPYIANPDLVERFKTGAPLNDPDLSTFYGGGEEGYVDYTTLSRE